MLRWKLFTKTHVFLVLQLVVITTITVTCMFAGPLAKVSLRNSQTIREVEAEVLKACNDNPYGSSLNANVKWNDTITSLNQASYPYTQLLDYLPPSTLPWTYVSNEWSPNWSTDCTFQEETLVENLEANGQAGFDHALDAFPKYQTTYDALWLNKSEYRVVTNFNAETNFSTKTTTDIKDIFVWFIIQSDPTVGDRLHTNRELLKLSVSVLHARNFTVLVGDDATNAAEGKWRPSGPIANASYTRMECDIFRNSAASYNELVSWPWTNDTYSIGEAYSAFWMGALSERSTRDLLVTPPSSRELFRFYQAYMVASDTWQPRPYVRKFSVWKDTVQVSTICLIFLLALTLLEAWLAVRYFWFLQKNKLRLERTCVPDGKVEWMLWYARQNEQNPPTNPAPRNKPPKDRDYFRRASFGIAMDPRGGVGNLAHVSADQASIINASNSIRLPDRVQISQRDELPRIVVEASDQGKIGTEICDLKRCTSCASSQEGIDSAVGSDRSSMYLPTRNPTSGQDDNTLRLEISHVSSSSKCSSEPASRESMASSPNLSLSLTRPPQDDDVVDLMDLSTGNDQL